MEGYTMTWVMIPQNVVRRKCAEQLGLITNAHDEIWELLIEQETKWRAKWNRRTFGLFFRELPEDILVANIRRDLGLIDSAYADLNYCLAVLRRDAEDIHKLIRLCNTVEVSSGTFAEMRISKEDNELLCTIYDLTKFRDKA